MPTDSATSDKLLLNGRAPYSEETIRVVMDALNSLCAEASVRMRYDRTWYVDLPNVWIEEGRNSKSTISQDSPTPQRAITECFEELARNVVLVNRYNNVFIKRLRWVGSPAHGKWQRIWHNEPSTKEPV